MSASEKQIFLEWCREPLKHFPSVLIKIYSIPFDSFVSLAAAWTQHLWTSTQTHSRHAQAIWFKVRKITCDVSDRSVCLHTLVCVSVCVNGCAFQKHKQNVQQTMQFFIVCCMEAMLHAHSKGCTLIFFFQVELKWMNQDPVNFSHFSFVSPYPCDQLSGPLLTLNSNMRRIWCLKI